MADGDRAHTDIAHRQVRPARQRQRHTLCIVGFVAFRHITVVGVGATGGGRPVPIRLDE